MPSRSCAHINSKSSRSLPATDSDPGPQPSIDIRHEALTRYLRTLVVAIGLARRQRNLNGVQVIVKDSRQQMCDAIEPGLFLVVAVHHAPRAHLSVGLGEHKVLCL